MSTLISVEDASTQLRISVQRVRTLCRTQKITAKKVGNTWVIKQSSIDRYKILTSGHIIQDVTYKTNNLKPTNKPIVLSFFSGAMGLDLGIEKAGFEIKLACEVDKYCRQTIAINKPTTTLLGDINSYESEDILTAANITKDTDIDLIIGGPPCQAFSTAGKRKGFNDDRGNVFLKYLSLALELNPKYFIIENVRGLLSCPMTHRPHDQRGEDYPELSEDELKGGALNFVISQLKKSGYGFSFNLYNAANFGTPQSRERVIIICSRDGTPPPFLTPTHSVHGEHGLPKWKAVRPHIKNIDSHQHLNFPEKRLKYYRLLKAGQNWRNLPEDLQKEALGKSYFSGGGKTGFLRRLAWNKPSPTLVTHPAMPATDLAHPEEDRPLSIQEYKCIQEFPDTWQIAGPLIQQYKQIGNAVPISLGYAVGSLIIKLLSGTNVTNIQEFNYSRYKRTSHLEWEQDFRKRKSIKPQSNLKQTSIEFD